MFNDIFSKKTSKKEKEKPVIIADIHEKDSLIVPELIENKIDVKMTYLEVADYLIGDTAIERKTINDFISSFYSKRLFEQLTQIQRYVNKILIIEGDLNELNNKIEPNVLRGAILSIITDFKTSIIYTKDFKETSVYLAFLAKKLLKKKSNITFHSRIPKSIKEQKQYILESFPKIGPATSKKLLNDFKNLKSIFNASEDELKKVLKSKTKGFLDLLDNNSI